ncbi:hypothetical protein [Arthrobacter sp. 92]|jgi:hypothetical protein|uniref:hypothetical protein n=1 Tax=Arthrobacter sp. 92 TaxID=3418175 RepID=UPI003D0343CA
MEGTVQQGPRPPHRWIWSVLAGFAIYVVGLTVGLQKVGRLCGSPLIPQSREAELFDSLRRGSGVAGQCYQSIASAEGPTWTLIVLGIAVVLAGVTVRVISINR